MDGRARLDRSFRTVLTELWKSITAGLTGMASQRTSIGEQRSARLGHNLVSTIRRTEELGSLASLGRSVDRGGAEIRARSDMTVSSLDRRKHVGPACRESLALSA